MISYWGVDHGSEEIEKGLRDWARSKRHAHLKRKEFNNWSKAQDIYEKYPIDLSDPKASWDKPPPMLPRDQRKAKRYAARSQKAWMKQMRNRDKLLALRKVDGGSER